MSDNVFGPDRDDEPGVTPVPGHAIPPQLTDFMVESCVIHSKSQGWLPGVVLRLATDDGAGLVCSIIVDDALAKIVEDIAEAATRAITDVRVAKKNGTLK